MKFPRLAVAVLEHRRFDFDWRSVLKRDVVATGQIEGEPSVRGHPLLADRAEVGRAFRSVHRERTAFAMVTGSDHTNRGSRACARNRTAGARHAYALAARRYINFSRGVDSAHRLRRSPRERAIGQTVRFSLFE